MVGTAKAERVSSYWPQLNRPEGDNSPVHTVCEQMDFHWTQNSVAEFRRLWRSGLTMPEIAEHFDRDPDEVLLLVIDQARRGFIEAWRPPKQKENGGKNRAKKKETYPA